MSFEIVKSHLANSEWRLAEVAALALLEQSSEPHERGLILAMLSRANFRLGRPTRALKYWEEAAALTEHWEVSLSVGEAMLAVGDPLVARTLLLHAVEQLPSDGAPVAATVGLRVALALAWRASGQPEAGIAVAGRALSVARTTDQAETQSEVASAWYALAVCCHAAGQVEEAQRAI